MEGWGKLLSLFPASLGEDQDQHMRRDGLAHKVHQFLQMKADREAVPGNFLFLLGGN